MPIQSLSNFTGAAEYTSLKGFPSGVKTPFYMTDGVRYVAENGGGHGAFWLITAIMSYQYMLVGTKQLLKRNDDRLREMQNWKLKVTDKSAILTCVADTDEPPAIEQKIEYTDFDLPEITIWVEYGSLDGETPAYILLLPSEH